MYSIKKNKQPLISVIMNCLNGAKYLKEAIDSVYAQSYSNWEIIFWDNDSEDDSSNIANSYDDRVRYFKSTERLPLHQARNLAINKCKGEAIAFLDTDDIWLPDKLTSQVKLLSDQNKIIYGGYENIDENGKRTGVIQNHCPSGFITSDLLLKNIISQGSVLIDAELLRNFKFDESYHIMGDFDLWIRLSYKNAIVSVGESVELSRQHDSNVADVQKHKWLVERRYFYKKFLKKNQFFKYPAIFIYIIKAELKGLINSR